MKNKEHQTKKKTVIFPVKAPALSQFSKTSVRTHHKKRCQLSATGFRLPVYFEIQSLPPLLFDMKCNASLSCRENRKKQEYC